MNFKKIGIFRYHIKNLNEFDEITAFRLKILAFINILFAFIGPILAQYYNLLSVLTFAAATIIAMFGILKTIGEKFVKFINDTTSFSKLFLIISILDLLYATSILIYFISPRYMIWVEMIIGTIHLPFFLAYSNALNNFINYFHHNSFTKFQNYRTNLNAESSLIGLILAIVLTMISIKLTIIVFSIGLFSLSIYQFFKYKMFKKYDFKYMWHYKHNSK